MDDGAAASPGTSYAITGSGVAKAGVSCAGAPAFRRDRGVMTRGKAGTGAGMTGGIAEGL